MEDESKGLKKGWHWFITLYVISKIISIQNLYSSIQDENECFDIVHDANTGKEED